MDGWHELINNAWCFINLREVIANHASKLLWGNGYNFTSEEPEYKKAIEKIKEWNNLDSMFYQDAKTKSEYGYSIIQYDKSKTGAVYLNLAQPYAQSRVARVMNTTQGATTWSRLMYDDRAIYVKTTYTKNQIRRYFTSDYYALDGIQDKISKDVQLPLVENHNLGIVPVRFMQNLPQKNFYGGTVGDYYPDTFAVKGLQKLLNHAWMQLWKELEYNRTRVFLDITNQEVNKLDNAYHLKKLMGDFILQANLRMIGGTGSSPPIEVMKGDPVLDRYTTFKQWILDKSFEFSGYSPINDATNQKTEAEVLIVNSRDMETTRVKRTLNQSDWQDIFSDCFKLMGLDGDKSKFTFEIKENTILDRLKQLEISERKVAMGVSNIKREIMKIEGVSEQEAEQILAENRKYQKQEMLFNAQFINQENEKSELGKPDNGNETKKLSTAN